MELDALRLVIKITDTGSMSAAARQLGLSRSGASQRLQSLEHELGAKLFQRTTRAIALTPDGQHLLERARRLVADADELAALFSGARNLRGRIRVDVPTSVARNVILPRLGELMALHPQLEIELSTSDRRVDLVREGFDCVLRVGGLGDPSLTANKLGVFAMVTVVGRGYAQRYGVPRTPDDLGDHFVVHYAQTLGDGDPTIELMVGEVVVEYPMRHLLAVNGIDAYRAAGHAGFGMIQVPRYAIAADLMNGAFIEVLADYPAPSMPVAIVHPYGRHVPRRVRVFMGWLAGLMEPHMGRAGLDPATRSG